MKFRHDSDSSWSRLDIIIIAMKTTILKMKIIVAEQATDIKREVEEEENLKKHFKLLVVLQ